MPLKGLFKGVGNEGGGAGGRGSKQDKLVGKMARVLLPNGSKVCWLCP